MMNRTWMTLVSVFVVLAADSAEIFVDGASGLDANSGYDESSPKRTIQSAIDAASAGDTIHVAAGEYQPIVTNNKRISIVGTSGASSTVIDGGGTQRCASLGTTTNESETVLSGFTLRNGSVNVSWNGHGGAGVRGGTVTDCVITNCRVSGSWSGYGGEGGGAADSKLRRCEIVDCKALAGGGANTCELLHCVVRNCYAYDDGGGLHCCVAENSLVVRNYGNDCGGYGCGYGVFGSVAYNCTIAFNTGRSGGGIASSTLYNSIAYANAPDNVHQVDSRSTPTVLDHCVTENPVFVDAENGDYRICPESPCVDAGDNAYVTQEVDLARNNRVSGSSVDVGAYEYQQDGLDQIIWTTIQFDPNWSGGVLDSRRYVSDSVIRFFPPVTRTGYAFEGWYTAADGGTVVELGTPVASCPAVLYAHWADFTQQQRCALDIGSFGALGDDGTTIWTLDANESFFGGSSLKSAVISHSQSTFQTLTVSGSGTLSFYWKASSESNYDWLRYFVDGVQRGQISGSTSWTQVSVDLEGEGDHVIKWQYSKDGSVNSGSDCGWIDCVTWTGADPGQPDDPVAPGQQGGLLHRWSLNGNLRDSVTGLEGASIGSVTTDGSSYTLPGGSRGTGYLNLGHAFPTNEPAVTLEIWATQISTKYYSHIFHVGTKPNLCMEWSLATMIGYDELGCPGVNIDNNGFCTHLAPYTLNTEFHISVVIAPQGDGTSRIAYCKRDATTGEILKKCEYTSPSGWGLGILDDDVLCLGHDIGGSSENDANARYNEVRIWNRALTDDELKASVLAGADAVISGAVRHTITFDLNGGGEISSREYEDGDPLGELPVPVRPFYVFMGWFTAAEGGGEVRADTLVVSDMTLYARWVKEGEVMVLSARTRDDDASVLDVVYRVSSTNASVNVRALAFEDGDESFAKVVRPETFLDGTGANLGYAVPANTNLVLSWKVTDDWDVKLARVKFMILVEENFYPVSLDLVTIPANGQNRALTFSTNELGEDVVRDALFWLYANHDEGLSLENGVLKSGDVVLANGAELVHPEAERYVFKSMDFRLLEGAALQYVNETARLELMPQGNRQYAYRQD